MEVFSPGALGSRRLQAGQYSPEPNELVAKPSFFSFFERVRENFFSLFGNVKREKKLSRNAGKTKNAKKGLQMPENRGFYLILIL